MARQTTVIYPGRRPEDAPGNKQPELPPCRAFRIIPLAVDDVTSLQAAVAFGQIPPAGVKTADGLFPVWVRPTNPLTDQEERKLLLIDHDGWIPTAMGKKWRIEYVGAASNDLTSENPTLAIDSFAYAVETVDDLDEAGQVNKTWQPPLVQMQRNFTPNQDFSTDPFEPEFTRPRGATGLVIQVDRGNPNYFGTALNGHIYYQRWPGDAFKVINQAAGTITPWVFAAGNIGLGAVAYLGSAARLTPAGVSAITARVIDPAPPPMAVKVSVVLGTFAAAHTDKFLEVTATWSFD